ncbi:tetratricopeptide repeat protein [Nonlabens ulvanivorans]|uniref:tetratricopeptide repeat protein n=1 Tax=Nonlabens ulvanivorans TaxID=906888 RepID=UPI002942E229|nr:hypothetical protein [Nonlabens ulvanivorans]WOI23135.1 hypothetical protein R1T42_01550 [Nonlabens ulvanivorans]
MLDQHILRIKSAMVIYALEKTLGNYVLNSELGLTSFEKNEDSVNSISNILLTEDSGIKMLVESSYLDDIFTLAIKATISTSMESKMKQLKKYCSLLNIFDIRNAISHPNRPFPDVYWFRSAAIASDPLIIQLGLNEVRQSLNSALEDKISAPPEEWINNVSWAILNTLPNAFDHEITGLLGRDKEFKDLELTLSKNRNNLIAVVAPGGVGKTALILQFLRDISLSPKWAEKINSILFCSLKNEKLTADGIESIEAIDGIEQIELSILTDLQGIYGIDDTLSFEQACIKLENEKILICIDNLETLLIDNQEEFKKFNEQLPLLWRVIVTSRISIDSATTVPLQALGKRHAIHLSRSYLRKRGFSDFKQDDLETIAKKANNNPLAIRLTIDLYIKGNDITKSISTSQKEIAAFSYSNLIESMTETSISILEAIYVSGISSKNHLVELLETSQDDVSESINELSKTSLIIRSSSESGNDRFDLSNSIRDLLLTNPRNIEIRNKIAFSLKTRNLKIQEQISRNLKLGITSFDEDFVDSNADPSIQAAIADLNKYLNRKARNTTEISNLKNRFSDLLNHNSKNHELLYHYSRIYNHLKDSASEMDLITRSLAYDDRNPRSLKAQGLNLFNSGAYDEANDIFQRLIERELDQIEKSSRKFSYSLLKLYLLSYLFQGKYQQIIEFTSNWKTHSWDIMLGTYRASAYRRIVEGKNNRDGEREIAYNKILDIFDEIFESKNYSAIACVEGVKIIREMGSIFSFISQYNKEFVYRFILFVSKNYFEMISIVKDENIDSTDNQDFLKTLFNFDFENKQNPLRQVSWYKSDSETAFDKEHIDELLSEGYTIVQVYRIPQNYYGMPSYLFAKDSSNEFYLNVDSFESGWNGWGYIQMDDKLAIKYKELNKKEATRATEIVSIDKYLM